MVRPQQHPLTAAMQNMGWIGRAPVWRVVSVRPARVHSLVTSMRGGRMRC